MEQIIKRLKRMIDNGEEVYVLEYSRYSDNADKYPFHIGMLEMHVQASAELFKNRENDNQWSIIFIGTQQECNDILKTLIED